MNKVRFRTVSAKALVQTVAGPEAPYDVYRLSGNKRKFERPQRAGVTYRWINS